MCDSKQQMISVAVITSTIGRAHLERAIESVRKQTYPCKHYVFVDGAQFADEAKKILEKYPEVIATYLPMNTGANRWTNSSINAIAPFLVKEEVICYLDDDNWYEPTHIEEGVKTLEKSNVDYAYALRNFYDKEGEFICLDTTESTGFYGNRLDVPYIFKINMNDIITNISIHKYKTYHIDTNCYIMRKATAIKASQYWYSGVHNDTNVFKALTKMGFGYACTKKFTVNYEVDLMRYNPTLFKVISEKYPSLSKDGVLKIIAKALELQQHRNLENYDGVYPWDK